MPIQYPLPPKNCVKLPNQLSPIWFGATPSPIIEKTADSNASGIASDTPKESFDGNDKSWLVCFDGRPVINGVELARMDYAKLENKYYNVDIKDGLVGVFTKIDHVLWQI